MMLSLKEIMISWKMKNTKVKSHLNDFLNEDRIEEILVPRYNKWVRLYDFA